MKLSEIPSEYISNYNPFRRKCWQDGIYLVYAEYAYEKYDSDYANTKEYLFTPEDLTADDWMFLR